MPGGVRTLPAGYYYPNILDRSRVVREGMYTWLWREKGRLIIDPFHFVPILCLLETITDKTRQNQIKISK
jgi:hypothetical protein